MPFRILPDGFRPVWCYLVGSVRGNPVHGGRVFLFDTVCYCLLSAKLLHNLKKRYPSPNNLKAVDYITENPLLKKGLECHLLVVERAKGDIEASGAERQLHSAGFTVILKTEQNPHAEQVIST